jgi:hypothetical protein
MKASEVLLKSAKLLKTVGHCKNHVAIRSDGTPTRDDDPSAAAFCAIGVLLKVNRSCHGEPRDTIDRVLGGEYIITWNNAENRTADEVIQAFDAAAVVAMQEEGQEPEDVLAPKRLRVRTSIRSGGFDPNNHNRRPHGCVVGR